MTLSHVIEHVDTDASGIVHFSRYASLMETAVLSMLEERGVGLRRLALDGYDLRMREVRIVYRHPAVFGDTLRLEPAIERLGPASVRFGVAVGNEASRLELARGTLDFALVDVEGHPVVLPAALHDLLETEVPA
jgi:acyl-CoA thioester hydrolase